MTFGHAYHNLKEISYEYDFGLRTTLNAVDPSKVKSTDTLSPENAKRARVQSPATSSWSFFDFKQDESILKNLQGIVKQEYKGMFHHIGGTASLRFSSKYLPKKIPELLNKLLDIYKKNDFKETFPDLQSVIPINNRDIINKLNDKLIEKIKSKSNQDISLNVPHILDQSQDTFYYSGIRSDGKTYLSADIEQYYSYLENRNFDIDSLDIRDLFSHKLNIKSQDTDDVIDSFSIFKSIIFECEIEINEGKENKNIYCHLCDGQWYEIEKDYLKRLETTLDSIFIDNAFLEPCDVKKESDYNIKISSKYNNLLCFDKKFISIRKQSQIEPCDIFYCDDNIANFIHIKISTRSSSLSHLFNQGLNSIEYIRSEDEAREKFKEYVENGDYKKVLEKGKYSIVYGIISAKSKELKSKCLPIFSRISLMRAYKTCKLWGVDCSVVLIEDLVERNKSQK